MEVNREQHKLTMGREIIERAGENYTVILEQ